MKMKELVSFKWWKSSSRRYLLLIWVIFSIFCFAVSFSVLPGSSSIPTIQTIPSNRSTTPEKDAMYKRIRNKCDPSFEANSDSRYVFLLERYLDSDLDNFQERIIEVWNVRWCGIYVNVMTRTLEFPEKQPNENICRDKEFTFYEDFLFNKTGSNNIFHDGYSSYSPQTGLLIGFFSVESCLAGFAMRFNVSDISPVYPSSTQVSPVTGYCNTTESPSPLWQTFLNRNVSDYSDVFNHLMLRSSPVKPDNTFYIYAIFHRTFITKESPGSYEGFSSPIYLWIQTVASNISVTSLNFSTVVHNIYINNTAIYPTPIPDDQQCCQRLIPLQTTLSPMSATSQDALPLFFRYGKYLVRLIPGSPYFEHFPVYDSNGDDLYFMSSAQPFIDNQPGAMATFRSVSGVDAADNPYELLHNDSSLSDSPSDSMLIYFFPDVASQRQNQIDKLSQEAGQDPKEYENAHYSEFSYSYNAPQQIMINFTEFTMSPSILQEKPLKSVAQNDTRFLPRDARHENSMGIIISWPMTYTIQSLGMPKSVADYMDNINPVHRFLAIRLGTQLFEPLPPVTNSSNAHTIQTLWKIRSVDVYPDYMSPKSYTSILDDFGFVFIPISPDWKPYTDVEGIPFQGITTSSHTSLNFVVSEICGQSFLLINARTPCSKTTYSSCPVEPYRGTVDLSGRTGRAPIAFLTALNWIIIAGISLYGFSQVISLSASLKKLLVEPISEQYQFTSGYKSWSNTTHFVEIFVELLQLFSLVMSPRIPWPSTLSWFSNSAAPVLLLDTRGLIGNFNLDINESLLIILFYGFASIVAWSLNIILWGYYFASRKGKLPSGHISSVLGRLVPLFTSTLFIPILKNAASPASCTLIADTTANIDTAFQVTDFELNSAPFCWIGTQYWLLVVFGLIAFFLYLPSAIALQPFWQFLDTEQEIFYTPKFLSLVAMLKLPVILVSVFFSTQPWVTVLVLLFVSLFLGIYTIKRRPCSIFSIANWRTASFISSFWVCISALICILVDDTSNNISGIICLCGVFLIILFTATINYVPSVRNIFCSRISPPSNMRSPTSSDLPVFNIPFMENGDRKYRVSTALIWFMHQRIGTEFNEELDIHNPISRDDIISGRTEIELDEVS